MKGFFREYFSYSRSEIRSIVVILIVLTASAAFRIIKSKREPPAIDVTLLNQVSELVNSFEARKAKEVKPRPKEVKPRPFINYSRKTEENQDLQLKHFDPNVADIDELYSIGLKKEIASNIVRYRKAGGKFKTPEDIRKIYGMNDSIYNIFRDYISIKHNSSFEEPMNDIYSQEKIAEPQRILVELNTADSSGLKALRGIGTVFASRIIRYRERLGGFYSHEQLNEISGMDSLRYNLILKQTSIDPAPIRRININVADEKELKSHPYINPHDARSIIYYRRTAGQIKRLEELTENGVVPDSVIEKCRMYFYLEDSAESGQH